MYNADNIKRIKRILERNPFAEELKSKIAIRRQFYRLLRMSPAELCQGEIVFRGEEIILTNRLLNLMTEIHSSIIFGTPNLAELFQMRLLEWLRIKQQNKNPSLIQRLEKDLIEL